MTVQSYTVVYVLAAIGSLLPATSTLEAQTPPSAERLVAEATIASSDLGDRAYVPVTVNGHRGTLFLDLGTTDYLWLSPPLIDSLKLSASALDSLGIGSAVEYTVPYTTTDIDWAAMPTAPGLPPVIGLVGTRVLWHYDMLWDGPARRVRLYTPRSHPTGTSAQRTAPWFPPGITADDCMPITVERDSDDHYVSFPLTVNGHPIPSFFDSGNDVTAMNVPAAAIIGIHQSDPHVHLLPPDSSAVSYPDVGPQHIYSVKGLVVKMGPRVLSDHRVFIYQHIPSPDPKAPELDVGLDGFRDRLLWISYSTNHVCVSAPRSIRHN